VVFPTGRLIRLILREGQTVEAALGLLQVLTASERHIFWANELAYKQVAMVGVMGHRQVTDAYLAALARRRGGRLATFDAGLAELHKDVADLLPTTPT
jgi:uncharacterized protein